MNKLFVSIIFIILMCSNIYALEENSVSRILGEELGEKAMQKAIRNIDIIDESKYGTKLNKYFFGDMVSEPHLWSKSELELLEKKVKREGVSILTKEAGEKQILDIIESPALEEYGITPELLMGDNDLTLKRQYGFKHILERHKYPGDPIDYATLWPESFSEADIQKNIREALKYGKVQLSSNGNALVNGEYRIKYNKILDESTSPITEDIIVRIDGTGEVTGVRGGVIAAYPDKGLGSTLISRGID